MLQDWLSCLGAQRQATLAFIGLGDRLTISACVVMGSGWGHDRLELVKAWAECRALEVPDR